MARAALVRLEGVQPLALLSLPLVLALGVGAVYAPTLTLAGAVGLVVVAAMLSNLAHGVALLTFLTVLEQVPGISGVTPAKPLGLVLLLSWALALAREGASVPFLPRDNPLLAFALAGFVAFGGASAAWAADSGVAISSAVRLMLVVVLFFVVYSAVRTAGDLLVVSAAFVAGAFLVTVLSLVSGQSASGGRLSGGGEFDPNFLAAMLVAAFVLAGFMLTAVRRPLARFALVVAMTTFVVAMVLTESRGALVGGAAALVAGCIVAGPARGRIVGATLVLVSVGIVYFTTLAPATLQERVTNISAEGSSGRSDSWQVAFRMAQDNPVAGVGLGNFRLVQVDYVSDRINLLRASYLLDDRLVTHNTYLGLASELGAIGIVLLLAIVVLTLGSGLDALSTCRERTCLTCALARGLVAAMIGLLTAYVFLSGEYEKQLWLLLGLVAALPTVARSLERGAATR